MAEWYIHRGIKNVNLTRNRNPCKLHGLSNKRFTNCLNLLESKWELTTWGGLKLY
jgi:hypothetical protein